VKLRTISTRPAELQTRAIGDLAVLVQFGRLVVAVAAQRVARIVLAEEAVPAPPRATPRIQIGGTVMPAWDLGKLLGIREPTTAWLVVTTTDQPDAPEIALGTGPCIAVATHASAAPLPGGVVVAPEAAVVGVFATDPALRERGIGELGVRVDPLRLIGPAALAAAQRGER
jgi:hypothetical protein